MSDEVPSVTPREVEERRRAGEDVFVLDVREPEEHRMAHLDGTVDVPMGDVPARIHELPRDREIVVMCHHGMRSLAVADFLRGSGLDAVNLAGGIHRWAAEVDESVGRY